MAFKVCGTHLDGTRDTTLEVTLVPGPSYPEYPERFPYSIQETAGRGVRQRSKLQPKEFKWVWALYGISTPKYNTLYKKLFALQSHVRKNATLNPYIYVYEDVTGELGVYNVSTGITDPTWIRVLVSYVGRTVAKDSGNVRYDMTEMRFVIDDPAITDRV